LSPCITYFAVNKAQRIFFIAPSLHTARTYPSATLQGHLSQALHCRAVRHGQTPQHEYGQRCQVVRDMFCSFSSGRLRRL
jgi:hypothetical protein